MSLVVLRLRKAYVIGGPERSNVLYVSVIAKQSFIIPKPGRGQCACQWQQNSFGKPLFTLVTH